MQKTAFIIILILALTLTSISTTAANPLNLPTTLTYKGTSGQTETKTITVNNPTNQTITISTYISNLEDYITLPSTFTIPGNTTKTINITITFPSTTKTGNIFFRTPQAIYQTSITLQVTNPTTALKIQQIIPQPPTAGKDFALIFNQQIDTRGILIVNEEIIPVDIQKGLAIIKTEKDQFGNATLIIPHITNSSYSYGFTINPWGEPYFIIPADIELGDKKTIELKLDGTSLKYHKITIILPDGTAKEINTDEKGKITFTFDKVGTYTFKTTYGQKTIYNSVEIGWTGRKETFLHVYNMANMEAMTLKAGERYKITVTDKENEVIREIPNVQISGPDGLITLPLTAGTAWWTPQSDGFYTVFTTATDRYLSATTTVRVKGEIETIWIAYVLLAVAVAVAVFYLYKKDKLPKLFKSKKLEELDLL